MMPLLHQRSGFSPFLLGFCALLCAFSASLQAQNLIEDGGFEDMPLNAEGFPQNLPIWNEIKDTPIAKWSLSHSDKVEGAVSIRVERLNAKGNSRVSLGKVEVMPGCRYYFSCAVKSTQGRPGVLLTLLPENQGEPEPKMLDVSTSTPGAEVRPGMVSLLSTLAPKPNDFNRMDCIFTVPDGARYLSIQINYSWTMGTAWYDDFELIPLG